MPQCRSAILAAALAGTLAFPVQAIAADVMCNALVPGGAKMICPGFEPNWAVEFLCNGPVMTSNFIDAFSGDTITTTPGSVNFSSQDPWVFTTSHGVAGSVAYTPASCRDESDAVFDFTLTTTAVPGFSGPVSPICCRIE